MPELRDALSLLERAEHAASAGDFSSADALLRDAARIQEAELGPDHPDLANTLNNLAIVAERTGRPADAETFYRRAAAIAAESLPAEHPMIVESRRNLEDFCREHGLPIADASSRVAPSVAASSKGAPLSVEPAARRRPSVLLAWVAIVAIVVVAVAVLVSRQSSPGQASAVPPAAAPAAEPLQPPVVMPPPVEPARPPASSTRPSPASPLDLVTARLCQTFSTSGAAWRCDPPGDQVAPGPVVLYTRVRSSRDATIEHRWYRDDSLRQAVKLAIRANPSEGYRTYSRQTVNGAGNWRVEVRSASGDLLHEERFAVR